MSFPRKQESIYRAAVDSRFRGNDSIDTGSELEYPDQRVKVHKRESMRHKIMHGDFGAIALATIRQAWCAE